MRPPVVEPFPSDGGGRTNRKYGGADLEPLWVLNRKGFLTVELKHQPGAAGGRRTYRMEVIVRLAEPLAPHAKGARLNIWQGRVNSIGNGIGVHRPSFGEERTLPWSKAYRKQGTSAKR